MCRRDEFVDEEREDHIIVRRSCPRKIMLHEALASAFEHECECVWYNTQVIATCQKERGRERLGARLIHQKERKEEGEEGQIYKNERKGEKERGKSKLSNFRPTYGSRSPPH